VKAVTYVDIDRIELADVPRPTIQDPGDAILRVTTSAICGSDLHVLNGRIPGMEAGSVIGHEFMGIIDEVGPGVTGVAVGDRVLSSMMIPCGTCYLCRHGEGGKCPDLRVFGYGSFFGDLNGGQAELVRVPEASRVLRKVDAGLTDEQVLFAGDILSTGVAVAAEGQIKPGDVVAVIGCGPVGLFAIQAAMAYSPSVVYAVDSVDARLEMAQGFGAVPIKLGETTPVVFIQDHTEGGGADVVLECVGGTQPLHTALEMLRPGGRVAVVGVSSIEDFTINLGLTFLRGVDVKFCGTTDILRRWDDALRMVAEGTLKGDSIISHSLPLDDAMRGYDLFKSRQAMKVVLKP
jgi:threonine dehydrogenase-like Zn-dependent dehydrogenase